MKVKNKRVVTDTSSMIETDSTIYQPPENNRKRPTQPAQHQPLPSNPVQATLNQHPQVQPQTVPINQGYPAGFHPMGHQMAYSEGVTSGIFMPFWVLPNKRGMIAASSVPNLA